MMCVLLQIVSLSIPVGQADNIHLYSVYSNTFESICPLKILIISIYSSIIIFTNKIFQVVLRIGFGRFARLSIKPMVIFHPTPETEFQLPVLPNNDPIHQRYKGVWIKLQAFLLLLQHPEESLDPPSVPHLILLLVCNPPELLAGFFILRCWIVVLLLIFCLIHLHSTRCQDNRTKATRNYARHYFSDMVSYHCNQFCDTYARCKRTICA